MTHEENTYGSECFFSIIVPVYNRKEYIRGCLDSILKQTFTDFELIVVDDGSTDDTDKICEEYKEIDTKIKIFHQQNLGVSSARNAGIRHAKGVLCIFIDSDDRIPSDYLMQIKEAYDKFGINCLYVTSFMDLSEERVNYVQFRKSTAYSIVKEDRFLSLLEKGLFNSACNKIYQLSLLKQHCIFFPEQVTLGEDMVFNLRYCDKMDRLQFVVINQAFYHHDCLKKRVSLEELWREDYLQIQEILLQKKVKYIRRWIEDGKLPKNNRYILQTVYNIYLSNNKQYYIEHKKDIGFIRMILMLRRVENSAKRLRNLYY